MSGKLVVFFVPGTELDDDKKAAIEARREAREIDEDVEGAVQRFIADDRRKSGVRNAFRDLVELDLSSESFSEQVCKRIAYFLKKGTVLRHSTDSEPDVETVAVTWSGMEQGESRKNTEADRNAGVDSLLKELANYDLSNDYSRYVIVGHSHGGTVALNTFRKLKESCDTRLLEKCVGVFTLGTPYIRTSGNPLNKKMWGGFSSIFSPTWRGFAGAILVYAFAFVMLQTLWSMLFGSQGNVNNLVSGFFPALLNETTTVAQIFLSVLSEGSLFPLSQVFSAHVLSIIGMSLLLMFIVAATVVAVLRVIGVVVCFLENLLSALPSPFFKTLGARSSFGWMRRLQLFPKAPTYDEDARVHNIVADSDEVVGMLDGIHKLGHSFQFMKGGWGFPVISRLNGIVRWIGDNGLRIFFAPVGFVISVLFNNPLNAVAASLAGLILLTIKKDEVSRITEVSEEHWAALFGLGGVFSTFTGLFVILLFLLGSRDPRFQFVKHLVRWVSARLFFGLDRSTSDFEELTKGREKNIISQLPKDVRLGMSIIASRQRLLGLGSAGVIIQRLGIALGRRDRKSRRALHQVFSASWPGHGAYLQSAIATNYLSCLIADSFHDRFRRSQHLTDLREAALQLDIARLVGATNYVWEKTKSDAINDAWSGSDAFPFWSERGTEAEEVRIGKEASLGTK